MCSNTNYEALAWAIDCEGSICFIKRKKKNWFSVIVQIGMCDREFPESMKRIFKCGNLYKQERPNPRHRDFYWWRVQKQSDVEKLLINCLPFFIVKGKKARMALDILKYKKTLTRHRRDGNTGRFLPSPPEAIKQFNIFHEQIKALTTAIR